MDQVGFINTRETRDNVVRTIHIAQNRKTPLVLLGIDAEKVFDQLNWTFMEEIVKLWNWREKLISWVKEISSKPVAQIKINGKMKKFKILEGKRQGCPLSPVIFALTLEPLLQKIRPNNIKELKIEKLREQKVSAYAGNLLFYIGNPRR